MDLNINKIIRIFILPIVVFYSSQSTAVSVKDAIDASNNDDAVQAAKLWSQLANKGNSIAQYNLANHYHSGQGIKKDKALADKWLKGATRSGLIQAYLNLNKKAIRSAEGQRLTFQIGPDVWLKKQEPNKYTIQLASSRNESSIKKSYEENNLKGNGGYYHYTREGVDRYALVYGAYRTVAAANEAMKNLPKALRKKTPWVRKIKSIQKISK